MGKGSNNRTQQAAPALTTPLAAAQYSGGQHPLARGIPGVEGERPAPQFGLGGYNDAAMALAYGGQTPEQANQNYQQSQARAAAPQGRAPGQPGGPVGVAGAAGAANGGSLDLSRWGGFNPYAYLAANKDVADHYTSTVAPLISQGWDEPFYLGKQRTVVQSPEDWALYHYQNGGINENRSLGL